MDNIIKIQAWYRGCKTRLRRLPLILYTIQQYLKQNEISLSFHHEDGRINSSIDEEVVIKLLVQKFGNRIQKPRMRMWYDILAYDYRYGWIPINIKTTTMDTADNTGNMAMCVYAYTDHDLNLNHSYENGPMSKILLTKLANKQYNKCHKKDYYFIVVNKNNPTDIIINSVKGLDTLTPNVNNLPFQVRWNKNRHFQYETIDKRVILFIKCLKKPKPSWKEDFMATIRNF